MLPHTLSSLTLLSYHVLAMDWCTLFFSQDTLSDAVDLVLHVPTSLAAIGGNILVMLSIWRTPNLHSPSFVLLFGLAMADLGVGLLVQPFLIMHSLWAIIAGQSRVTCSGITLVLGAAYFFCCVSLLTLTLVSVDRYMAITLHLRYKGLVTSKRMILLLVPTWLYSALATAISFSFTENLRVYFIHAATISSVCICVMSFCYLKILQVGARHQKEIARQQPRLESPTHGPDAPNMARLRKSSFLRFQICFIFLVCYLPYVVSTVWLANGRKAANGPRVAFKYSSKLVLMSSCVNPVVYCLRLREMRAAFRKTLAKFSCSFGLHPP